MHKRYTISPRSCYIFCVNKFYTNTFPLRCKIRKEEEKKKRKKRKKREKGRKKTKAEKNSGTSLVLVLNDFSLCTVYRHLYDRNIY